MKRIYLLILVLGTMLPGVVSNVQANDYLEHSSHYTVQGMDNNVLRFNSPDPEQPATIQTAFF